MGTQDCLSHAGSLKIWQSHRRSDSCTECHCLSTASVVCHGLRSGILAQHIMMINCWAGQFRTIPGMSPQTQDNDGFSIQTCLWQQRTRAGQELYVVLVVLFVGGASSCYRYCMPEWQSHYHHLLMARIHFPLPFSLWIPHLGVPCAMLSDVQNARM